MFTTAKLPPYLPYSLAFLWAWSGLQPLLSAPEVSLALLARVGFPPEWQMPVLLTASLLDLAFAIGCCSRLSQNSLFWLAQWLTVAAYSLIIAFSLPDMWLHPFAPLIKNIPILALLTFLFQHHKASQS